MQLSRNSCWVRRAEPTGTGRWPFNARRARRSCSWSKRANCSGPGKSLTQLKCIGPYLARRLAAWLEGSPEVHKPPLIRWEFQTPARAEEIAVRRGQKSAQLIGGHIEQIETFHRGAILGSEVRFAITPNHDAKCETRFAVMPASHACVTSFSSFSRISLFAATPVI